MELPSFFIVGARPVKAVRTEEGGMDVLAFDWKTGELRRDLSYLERIVMPDVEVDVVTEAAFEEAVAALRAKL